MNVYATYNRVQDSISVVPVDTLFAVVSKGDEMALEPVPSLDEQKASWTDEDWEWVGHS